MGGRRQTLPHLYWGGQGRVDEGELPRGLTRPACIAPPHHVPLNLNGRCHWEAGGSGCIICHEAKAAPLALACHIQRSAPARGSEATEWGCVVQMCGHAAHVECWKAWRATQAPNTSPP